MPSDFEALAERVEKAVEGLHLANVNMTKLSGQLDMQDQKYTLQETIHQLERQVIEKQMVRLENDMVNIRKEVDANELKMSRYGGMITVISTIVVVIVGFVQAFFFKFFKAAP